VARCLLEETIMQIRLGWILAVVCVAATASASPRPHITVLDFEGPHRLADAGRHLVMSALGNRYDIVAAKRWELAHSSTASGPLKWTAMAKAAGVDAVVEGWIDPVTHAMTVVVRDAASGRQIDTIAVPISEQAVVGDDQIRKLSTELDDLLQWVDATAQADTQHDPPPTRLPAVNADRSYPTGEPVIEVLLTGGFVSRHQGAVIWADGSVQLFGPGCMQHGKLTPARVAVLIDDLARSGIFDAGSDPSLCVDGLDVEVDVRENSQRVAAHSSLCGYGASLPAQAYDRVWAALGPNPCGDGRTTNGDDDN
jgi:hypothetical protein